MKVKYLILGAGPSGLSFANRLKQLGEKSFLVVEKEKEAGGLCRTEIVDDSPLDIGGGHFLDVRSKKVNDFLFEYLPENEWNLFERDSRIAFKEQCIGHPFESNIWQLPQDKQIEYLKSIAIAGCNLGLEMPMQFVEWIYWKLGNRIAEDYMLPYNSKMFGDDLNQLGTYWLKKLPNVSFEETLLSCLNKKPYGTQPGHAQFYYPKKYGYGEVWTRMSIELGKKIVYDSKVIMLDVDKKMVKLEDGTKIEAEYIITTIPWTALKEVKGIGKELAEDINKLKHTSVTISYYGKNLDTNAQWIYYPASELDYHRILVRSNFVENAKGYWTETNTERCKESNKELSWNNEYAYPLNTIEKPQIMKRLLKYANSKHIIGLGRWGEWEHYNSDVTVMRGMELAENIFENS